MAMDPLLIAAIKARQMIVHLVTVDLPVRTIRWTDGGFVRWAGHTYLARDPDYGALDSIGTIVDGIEEDGEPVPLSIIPPDLASLADLAAADAQGGWVTIHLGAIDRATGVLIGQPYQLFVGELDQPRLSSDEGRVLEYDVLPVDARGLEVNDEQRQTHAFRQMVWPGELGDEHATEGTKETYWREDDPKNAVGVLAGRGILKSRPKENKAIEFTYEPEAALAFPIGRCAIKGAMRYRVGYGPTNRWHTYFATVGASGPIKGLIKVTVGEEDTSFDGSGKATNGDHSGAMWFQFLPGAQPSIALTSPTGSGTAGFPAPGWSVDHKLSGRPAYAWTGFENSKKSEFGGGLPPVVLTLEGLYGWDARNGQPLDNRAAWPWIKDGATAGLNWIIGRWEGAVGDGRYGIPYQSWIVGGIGVPLDGIDVAAFSDAADIADANGWEAGGVPYSDEDKADVLEDLLAAAGAKRSRRCGLISCVSFGAPAESMATVTAADTAGPVETVVFRSRLDRRNTAIGRVLSEDHRWEMTALAPVTNPAWVAADGGRRVRSYDFPFVTANDQGAQLTYLALANDREGEGTVPFKLYMLALEPGQCFDWAEPAFLLDGVKARVWRREYSPADFSLKLKYRLETDAKYTEAFTQTGTAPPPTAPGSPPPRYGSARVPTRLTTPDESDLLPSVTSASETSITVADHRAWFAGAPPQDFESASITGLAASTLYGVFARDDGSYVAEASPALTSLGDDNLVFLGWQATPDGGGVYPDLPPRPPGSGGTGNIPDYIEP